MGIFSKINFGLTKTRNKMAGAIDDLLDSVGEINDDLYTELEELLVMHDVGVQTSLEIIEELRKRVPEKKSKIRQWLRMKSRRLSPKSYTAVRIWGL